MSSRLSPSHDAASAAAQQAESDYGSVSPSDFDFDFDHSLTLPPINPDHHYYYDQHGLPSFDDSHYFHDDDDANSFPSPPPISRDYPPLNQGNTHDPPSPSYQQPRRADPVSQYGGGHLAGSPDPFDEFLLSPPSRSPAPDMTPARSRPHTRSSSVVDLTESSPLIQPKKRKREESAGVGRVSKTKREASAGRRSRKSSLGHDVEVVDLENIETQKEYEEFKAKEQAEAIKLQNVEDANKPMRLAEFQCVICMDDPTDLTITHCGHLFCSECIHSALHAGDKKTCPVCRSTIVLTKAGAKASKNGLFPLEMKLMTANKKGKQAVKVR